jgi:hypothetical protein
MNNSLHIREYIKKDTPHYANSFIDINPKKTALVLIDLWNSQELTDLVCNKINPIIKIAREKGVLIIHSPSQDYENIHHDLDIHPNDLLITGYDDFGRELINKEIDTLLYAGFDTLFCVLDKPLGAINNYFRTFEGSGYRYILIRDSTSSECKETYDLGINLFEKLFRLTTTVLDICNFFNVRLSNVSTSTDIAFTSCSNKKNIIKSNRVSSIYTDNSAIVLFDDNRSEIDLSEILNWGKHSGIKIIQCLVNSNSKKYQSIEYIPSEKKFIQFIRNHRINNLFYLGGGLDDEMIFGHCGIMRLYIQKRYKNNPMPDCYIVEDCSWISTKPLSTSVDIIKKTLIERYRDVQGICTLDLMRSMKKGNKYTNRAFLKFYYFYSRVKRYRKYILACIGFVFILGLLIGMRLTTLII